MPSLQRKSIVLLTMQSAEGAFVTPLASDAIQCSELSVSFSDENIIERPELIAGSRLDMRQNCNVNRRLVVTFSTEVRGAGSTNITPPEVGNLLRVAGFDQTIGASNVIYSPTPTPNLWGSMSVYQDGLRYNLLDVVADFTSTIDASAKQIDSWTCTGRISTIAINQANPVVTYDSSKPNASLNLNMQWNGILLYGLSAMSYTHGNEISSNGSINGSDGLVANTIVGNAPTLGFTVLNNNPEVIDWNALWSSNFSGPLTMSTLGSTTGNTVLHTFPQLSLSSVTPGVDGKLLNTQVEMQCNESTGGFNDWYQRQYS